MSKRKEEAAAKLKADAYNKLGVHLEDAGGGAQSRARPASGWLRR